MLTDITFDFTNRTDQTNLYLKLNEVQQLRESGWNDDLIDKYGKYLHKLSAKNIKTKVGRTAHSDSQRSKVYKAENDFQQKVFRTEGLCILSLRDIQEANERTKQIVYSKTWEKLSKSVPKQWIHVKMKKTCQYSGYGGMAYSHGLIKLSRGSFNEYILLHELAHIAGNFHHDVMFRITLVKLVSAFMGVEYAKILKKCFRAEKLKMTPPKFTSPKQPSEWLEFHERMKKARSARSK